MGSIDPRTPVIVGVGQLTHRGDDFVSPLDLIEQAARMALTDCGAEVATSLDDVTVVNVLSVPQHHPAHRLAARLGIEPVRRRVTTIGGNTPQWLVQTVADDLGAGRIRGALIAGGEAVASSRRAKAAGAKLPTDRTTPTGDDIVIGDDTFGLSDAELAAGLAPPARMYPLFESALAARAGRTLDQQRSWLGDVMAPFTEVAARHRDLAWFPQAVSAADLAEVSDDNRMVVEPYTKRLNSILNVDQAAAIVMVTAEVAEAAGVPRERWVFPWASASANDLFIVASRPDLSRSPGIAAAAGLTLGAAGVDVDDLAWIDLYSCFPCAVQMGAEAIGVSMDDRRGLTVTGGLPYFGGPGNNYTTHSIATTVDLCRADPDGIGLTTGLGWFVTKHAVGLYSATPPPRRWQHPDSSAAQAAIDETALPLATGDDATGPATVDAFTVIHDRHGGPSEVPIVARLGDGRRVVAKVTDPEVAAKVSGGQLVGAEVRVTPDTPHPTFEL